MHHVETNVSPTVRSACERSWSGRRTNNLPKDLKSIMIYLPIGLHGEDKGNHPASKVCMNTSSPCTVTSIFTSSFVIAEATTFFHSSNNVCSLLLKACSCRHFISPIGVFSLASSSLVNFNSEPWTYIFVVPEREE
jgi:hypothetical protein